MIPTAEIRKILDLSLHWSTETRVQRTLRNHCPCLYKPQSTAESSTGILSISPMSWVNSPNTDTSFRPSLASFIFSCTLASSFCFPVFIFTFSTLLTNPFFSHFVLLPRNNKNSQVLISMGFPAGLVVKNPPAKQVGSIPGSGRSPGEEDGHPLQYPCLESPMVKWAWWSTVHGVAKELDMT